MHGIVSWVLGFVFSLLVLGFVFRVLGFVSWCSDLSFGCLEVSFGCLELSFGCLDLSFRYLDSSSGLLLPPAESAILMVVVIKIYGVFCFVRNDYSSDGEP